MTIVGCSLQCNDSGDAAEISCGVTNVFQNQEIRITFSQEVDPITVTNNTFQMIDRSGKTPAGTFSLDPNDSKTLIYRPQLTFDSAGLPVFGLTLGETYAFKVPGTAIDSLGPYIASTSGKPNRTRLQCSLVASEGVRDANPGSPTVAVTVDRVTGYDANGDPNEFQVNFPAPDATSVFRGSPVRFVFNDVMNPDTLGNPVSGESQFIKVSVDSDGNVGTDADQVAIAGSFTITIDQTLGRTTVIFTPSGGFPSAGQSLALPRRVVVSLSSQISDLGGSNLLNAGLIVFTPERIDFDPIEISEPFLNPSREDSLRTGSAWGADQLAVGPGGGSGRLGDLVVFPGTVVELSTDSEDFTGITNPAIFNPVNIIDRTPGFTVVGGVFEFSRLRVDSGGVLRFTGSNPARVYVRGVADIQGLIDVSGTSGVLQVSTTLSGGSGGASGPGGGAGGRGGSRPDGSAFTGNFSGRAIGGVPNPTAGPSNVLDPASYSEVNGVAGMGVPFPNFTAPTSFVGGGEPGLGWPQPTAANPNLHMPQTVTDITGLEVFPQFSCQYLAPSAPGGGGAHALDGIIGDATFELPLSLTLPPDSQGGDSALLQIDDLVRSLSPELGLLRGGGGGGGAGGHLQLTEINGQVGGLSCNVPVPLGSALQVIGHFAHSSAGGGGGGGALQVAAGRRVILFGAIDASGGDGGSGTFPPPGNRPTDLAQGGGAGAGGAVLIQSQRIQIQSVPNRINVSGGVGGQGPGALEPLAPSTGGNGSPGFLRLEADEVPLVSAERAKVSPTADQLEDLYGPSASVEDFFTAADWEPATDAPSGFSGAQSCWIRPTGNFFRLFFKADDAEGLGWDLRLRIQGFAEPQSFRGENDLFPGVTLEETFGSDLGTAPVVVRFQGARATQVLLDPCSVPESGVNSPLAPNSLTPWTTSPGELNTINGDDSLSPNIFRFVVLWDRSQGEISMIEGLEDLTVFIQPD